MQFSLILFHWDDIYNALQIKDFIYFIASSSIQDSLWPIKIVFIGFTLFFFCAVIWLYSNSSYLQYKFLQDTTEFFSKETYGLSKVVKGWKSIKKRIDIGTESELKLAVIEADDFLYESLGDAGFTGMTFEELIDNAAKKVAIDREAIVDAHALRNIIVYQPDRKVDLEQARTVLISYENAIKNIAVS